MPTRAPLNSQILPAPVTSRNSTVAFGNVRELISLATRGLRTMFDSDKQLFCHRLLRTEQGIVREGLSPRYTIMTLLGLKELESVGVDSLFDLQEIYASLSRNTNWIQGVGDLGLMVWLTAVFQPDRLESLLRISDFEIALDRYADAQEGRTMELAWFLSGLAHAARSSPILAGSLMDISVDVYHRIEENQDEYGLFGHMSTKKSLAGRFRGRIGSFADQVYPIYAMSKFATAFQVEDPLGPMMECVTAICGAQGDSGQWWWLYDARSGRVSSRYPVYSVHQHGMAPMALLSVEEATGQCFREYVQRGLRWIYGANELSTDMRDGAESLIWRCILPKNAQTKLWEMALSVVRPPSRDMQSVSLTILYEQRPYEFGWLLFALAKDSQTESPLKTSCV
jgi:hypothetical protein